MAALTLGATKLEHRPPREAVRGETVLLRARFAEGKVLLLYRADPERPYAVVPCEQKGDDWSCELPAAATSGDAVDYVLAGLNAAKRPVALFGTPDAPHRLRVVATATPVETPVAAPDVETPIATIRPPVEGPKAPQPSAVLVPLDRDLSMKTVIDRDLIRRSGANDIPELLKRVAGIDAFTKTYADQGVGIRGSAKNRTANVLVLVAGQPVNAPHHGAVNWAALPIALVDIERIEIIRGPSSHEFGADAMAGVIDIVLRAPGAGRSQLDVAYGERGAQRYHLRSARKLGEARVAVSAGWRKTENAQRFKTPDDLHTDYTLKNGNRKDFFEAPSVSVSVDAAPARASTLELFGALSSGRGGENARPGDFAIDDVRTLTALERVTYRHTLSKGLVFAATESMLFAHQENTAISTSGTTETHAQRFAIHGQRFDLDIGLTHTSGDNLFGGGVALNVRSVDSAGDRSILTGGDSSTTYNVAAYFRDTLTLARWLDLNAALRFDYFTDIGAQVSPRATLAIRAGAHRFTIGGGMAFRRPDVFTQNYFEAPTASTAIVGNAALHPERMVGIDAQYTTIALAGHTVAATVYGQSVSDGIEPETTTAGGIATTTFVNRAKYEQVGGELEIDGRPADWLRYFVNASIFFGRVTQSLVSGAAVVTSSHTNRRAPNYKANLGVMATWAPHIDFGLYARYTHSFSNYDELVQTLATNDYRLEAAYSTAAWVSLDATLTGKIGKHVKLGVSAQNLLDRRHYDYPIYTKLARKVMATLQLTY